MEVRQIGRGLLFAAALLGGIAAVQAQAPLHTGVKGGSDEQGDYISYKGWWKSAPDHTPNCNTTAGPGGSSGVVQPGGRGGGGRGQENAGRCWVWGEVSGMAADTPNRIIVAVWGDRDVRTGAERPGGTNYVIEVDGNGNLIKRWSQWDNIFNTPHQVYISPYDPERNIYIVERGGTQPGVNGQPGWRRRTRSMMLAASAPSINRAPQLVAARQLGQEAPNEIPLLVRVEGARNVPHFSRSRR